MLEVNANLSFCTSITSALEALKACEPNRSTALIGEQSKIVSC